MIELTQHIEHLLLHHDCVIVPGLGGFVAQNCSATFVKEEGIFLPPYRSVTFNPRLTMNDGLLVQDIARIHELSYPQALQFVENEVNGIHCTLQQKGSFDIYGVGELLTSTGEFYEFKPLTCGIVSPHLFGLDCFDILPIKQEETKPAKVEFTKNDEESYTVNVRMGLMRYAAVAAVAAVFFFICLAPLNDAIHHDFTEASMFRQLWSLIVPAPETPAAKPVAEVFKKEEARVVAYKEVAKSVGSSEQVSEKPVKQEVREEALAKPVEKATLVEKNTPSLDSEKPYTIVLASSVPEKGAEAMVAKWKKAGHNDIRLLRNGKMIRVIYGNFSSEQEARKAFKTYKAESTDFKHGWIYRIP